MPEEFQADDVRYNDELVEFFLLQFTHENEVVFDPFMGFGTTLIVAEKQNRAGYGVEFDERRCRYVRSVLQYPDRALLGDSTQLDSIDLPALDFCMTSPPYMGMHHQENPFTAYTTLCGADGYQQYLVDLRNIYVQIANKMKSSARAVIEVSNLKHSDGPLTTLAWDIAREVSKVLRFEGETVIVWEGGYAYGYDHSYVLLFSKS